MRKKRRVELHIERREISIFSSADPMPAHVPAHTTGYIPADALLVGVQPAACPACGSPNLLLLTEVVAHDRFDLATLNQGMQDGSIHFHRSPSGEWWICTKHLHEH